MNINIIILWKNKYIYLYRLIILYISFTYWLSVLVTYRLPLRSHNSLIYYIRLLLVICMLWIVYYPIIASKILPRLFDFLTEKLTCLAGVRRLPNQTVVKQSSNICLFIKGLSSTVLIILQKCNTCQHIFAWFINLFGLAIATNNTYWPVKCKARRWTPYIYSYVLNAAVSIDALM